MRKSAINSITAPGSVVENLAVDAGYEKAKPKPPRPDKAPMKIHPMVELAMGHKMAAAPMPPPAAAPMPPPAPAPMPPPPPPPAPDPAFDPTAKQKIPSPEFLLPPKTPGEAISMDKLTALSHVADRSTGATPQTDLPGKGGESVMRSSRQSVGAHRNVSSLQQSKYAFARAELLSALYPYGLSKQAAGTLGEALLKVAFEGTGNAPYAGKVAIPQGPLPSRQAIGGGVVSTGAGKSRLPDGEEAIGSKLPAVDTPMTTAISRVPLRLLRAQMTQTAELRKAAALVELVKSGLTKQAVLDFLRGSTDKKAALLTIGRLHAASEQERATAKLAGLMRTYELAHSDGKGAMPSGPDGPVPAVLTKAKTRFATDWCNRLDPFSRKVPLARVMGRDKGNC